jgi:hypothetical protein
MDKTVQTLLDDFTIDVQIETAIRARLKDGKLACARAFAVAKTLDTSPLIIGQTATALDIHLDRCQLGLYGYPGHTKGWEVTDIATHAIPDGLEDAIRAALDDEERLTCLRAWEIAANFGVPKMLVGYIADTLNVHIVQCQLGAF